ncbi:MAG TPA: lipoyl(octanoyl) transferase LipB [Polyangiaceae bacterium]|nr:lipoyl(octanoyl) transferase LipB [Polyangiaceae bacterium]
MATSRRLHGVWLGRRGYESVHALQLELLEARKRHEIPDTVLLVEHDPVITLGRGANAKHLRAARSDLARMGVSVVETGRGGDVTLHAPGQLVCYPIVDLNPDRRDVRRYVNDLTRCMQLLGQSYGVASGTHAAYVGVWVDRTSIAAWPGEAQARDPAKLGAIGVRVSRWVTMHGFAFNLSTDLELFRWIVPCGISEFGVTSIQALTGRAPSVAEAAKTALTCLASVLDATLIHAEPREHEGTLALSEVSA